MCCIRNKMQQIVRKTDNCLLQLSQSTNVCVFVCVLVCLPTYICADMMALPGVRLYSPSMRCWATSFHNNVIILA